MAMTKTLAILLSIAISIIIPFDSLHSQESYVKYHEINKEMNREEDPEYKKGRERWFEEMHKAEPGTCWRAIESETRRLKQTARQEKIVSAMAQGIDIKELLQAEKFANGKITARWQERGSNNLAGRVHTVDIDWSRNLIYLASAGGNVWRGNINGADWECLNNSMQIKDIRSLKIYREDKKNRIIVFGNSPAAVHFTENEGLTWERSAGLENPERWGWIKRGVMTGKNKIIVAICSEWDFQNWRQVSSVYRSTDGGLTFNNLAKYAHSVNFIDVWASPATDEVFMLSHDTLFTIDGSNIMPLTLNTSIAALKDTYSQILLNGGANASETRLVAGLASQTKSATHILYAESPVSDFINKGDAPERPFMSNSLAITQKGVAKIFLGGVNCWKSSNSGINWSAVNDWADYYKDPITKLHADICGINSFIMPNGNELIIISTDGGLYRSHDGLETVENISGIGLNISQYYSTYTSKEEPYDLFVGSQDQGYQYCLAPDGDIYSLIQYYSGDYGHLSSSDNGKSVWSVYPGFSMLVRRFTGNFTLTTLKFKGSSNDRVWMPPIKAHPNDPYTAYMTSSGETGSKLWKLSFDDAKIIGEENYFDFKDSNTGAKASAIEISSIAPENIYVMTSNGDFFSSEDDGDNWQKTSRDSMPQAYYLYGSSIVASQKTTGLLYIAGSGYSNPAAFVTKDNGASFAPINNGLPNTVIYDIELTDEEDYLFAATEAGPYIFSVAEEKWYEIGGFGAPDQRYWTVEYIPSLKTARFGTYGRGIWDFIIEEYATAPYLTQNTETKPKIFAYPNPFNSVTRIKFETQSDGFASVRIYDITGRIVWDFNSGCLTKGIYELEWDGRTFGGGDLPSGAYTCIISSAGGSSHVIIALEN